MRAADSFSAGRGLCGPPPFADFPLQAAAFCASPFAVRLPAVRLPSRPPYRLISLIKSRVSPGFTSSEASPLEAITLSTVVRNRLAIVHKRSPSCTTYPTSPGISWNCLRSIGAVSARRITWRQTG